MSQCNLVELVDLQFVETRHKLLDVAAFLDRMDRHGCKDDYRVQALLGVLPLLLEHRTDRTSAVLTALSDLSVEPIPKAAFQGAFGAPSIVPNHANHETHAIH